MEGTSNEQYVASWKKGSKKISKLTFIMITAVDPNWLCLSGSQWYQACIFCLEGSFQNNMHIKL